MIFDRRKTHEVCLLLSRNCPDFSAEGRFWERRDGARRAAVLVKEEWE